MCIKFALFSLLFCLRCGRTHYVVTNTAVCALLYSLETSAMDFKLGQNALIFIVHYIFR